MTTSKQRRSARNRANERQDARDRLRSWYVIASNPDGKYERELVCEEIEEPRANGLLLFYIDPPIPNVQNMMVVERPFGNDGWSCGIFPRPITIKSYGGL